MDNRHHLPEKRVVITGMGVLSAIGHNLNAFQQALMNKKCGIKSSPVYLDHFEGANAAEILQPVDNADLPAEVFESLDKVAFWAYRVAREALSNSGLLEQEAIRLATALIIGVSSAGTEAIMPLLQEDMSRFSLQKWLKSASFSSCCASVASLLQLQGGFELVATACTASTNALGMGYDFIKSGKNKTALIIGTEPIYLPTFAGFYTLKAMKRSPTTPFSGEPGMSIGEGAGALVLEEYEHALARGATIYGEILSYATSGDAYHETAPDPRSDGAVRVMQKALANAGMTVNDIDYINAHGTGTEANDRCETQAMKKVFPNIMDIPVSSTKSYVGHNIGAAGIIEMIACFLTLPEKQILPTLNFTTPRVNCDLNYVPNDFQSAEVSVFMKNNYAFGGNNCCVISSLKPEVKPVKFAQKNRVVITGRGAITALGHDISTIMEKIWQDKPVDYQAQKRCLSTQDKQSMVERTEKMGTYQYALDHFDANFGRENVEVILSQPTWTYSICDLDPRKYLRRFDSRKADPINVYSLVALTQTLQDANRKIKRDADELGLVLGMSKGPLNHMERYLLSLVPEPMKARTSEFPGALMNAISTYCSISEGIKGYNTTLATGVNAALGALVYGYEIIRQDKQPQVLVGGADELSNTITMYTEALKGELLVSENLTDFQPYSADKKGYFTGEGAALLFLEEYHAAQARGAKIYGEIVGYGKANAIDYLSHIDSPQRANAMHLAILQAMDEAGVQPADIDLICGGSYNTPSSDVELDAVKQAFPDTYRTTPFVNYVAYFGLVESCIGILNLQIALEAMERQEIAPMPITGPLISEEFAFVREKRRCQLRHILLLGVTEFNNYYAIIVRKS